MTASKSPAELTAAQITVTLDTWDRPVVVLPDEIAERLTVSSRTNVKDYGYCHFESCRFDVDAWETHAVRTIFDVVVAAHPQEPGLGQYRQFGTGYFYGGIVGMSGWDMNARTWRDYDSTRHLHVHGIHLHQDGRSHFGS
ncbi:hypothetical protein [Streptomyces sirii]|uniref:hypothetical protein n=1 Tax=Streptomyces sirii TaxID=3127701 RepID=UPI003D363F8B